MDQFFSVLYCSNFFISMFCVSVAFLFLVVLQQNPVYSVFSFMGLVLCFSFGLVLVGAEFMALMLFVVYIGVIAVLFLFVIIMYNLKLVGFIFAGWVKFFVASSLVAWKLVWLQKWSVDWVGGMGLSDSVLACPDVFNFIALFNEHHALLLLCGLLLFIAMVGSIVITVPFASTFKKNL